MEEKTRVGKLHLDIERRKLQRIEKITWHPGREGKTRSSGLRKEAMKLIPGKSNGGISDWVSIIGVMMRNVILNPDALFVWSKLFSMH